MSMLSRWLVAAAAALLLGALMLPLWRIQLIAPQYPEGLGMVVGAGTVRGVNEHDLQSINSLNHYIGMKPIEPEQIAELRVMPWLIGGLAVAGLIVAVAGRRPWLLAWLLSLTVGGAIGLWDFYRWEYMYGHDLDMEHAIIKVPGMVYQPPLIGTKQLLNFTAASWPDLGAYAIGVGFALAFVAFALGMKHSRGAVARAAA